MTTLAKLQIVLGIDASGFSAGLQRSTKQTQDFAKNMKKFGDDVSGFGDKLTTRVSLPLGAIGVAAIKAASDTNESLSKMQVVFGEASNQIEKFAQNSARDLGMSRQATYEATATFGNLFTAMGMGQGPAADMSAGLVQLAADIASFNNLNPGDALEKLRSGIVGEAEPLRSVGIQIDATNTKAKAMQLGLIGAGQEMSSQAAITARYALIMEQSKNAQGDFARTSNGLANSTRIAKAELADAAATLGTKLIPLAISATGKVSDMAEAFDQLDTKMQDTIVTLGLVAVAAGPVTTALGGIIKAVTWLIAAGPALAAVLPALGAGAILGFVEMAHAIDKAQGQIGTYQPDLSAEDQQKLLDLWNRLLWAQQQLNQARTLGNEAQTEYWQNQATQLRAQYDAMRGTESFLAAQAEVNVLPGPLEQFTRLVSALPGPLEQVSKGLRQVATNTDTVAQKATIASNFVRQFNELLQRSPSWQPALEHVGLLENVGVTPPEPTPVPGSARYLYLQELQQMADDWKAVGEKAAADWQAAWDKAVSGVASLVSIAQGNLESLLKGTKLETLMGGLEPGANGAFENIYRAADIAKLGDKSPWAAKLGLDQATAIQIVNDFRQGLITEQVKALIDMPKLVEQVQMTQLAEQMTQKFAAEVAAQAGVGTSVVESLMGIQKSAQGTSVAGMDGSVSTIVSAAGTAFSSKASDVQQIGVDFMTNLGQGIAKAQGNLVTTVEGVARAMLEAMRAALGVTVSSPGASASSSGFAPAIPSSAGVSGASSSAVWDARVAAAAATAAGGSRGPASVTIYQSLPAGTSQETREAAREGARQGVVAAQQAMGLR